MKSILALAALFVPMGPGGGPAAAQEAEPPHQMPLLELAALELGHYRPRFADTVELVELAQRLVGREFHVQERGGYRGVPIHNLSLLGDAIVLYDTKEYVERMMATLRELDTKGPTDLEPAEELVTSSVTLKHVHAEEAIDALEPFRRKLPTGSRNMTGIVERRLIVLHDTPERVARMEELLRDVDVPPDQFSLRVQLLRANAVGGQSISDDLASELEKLLPGQEFASVGFAMLQSAVTPGRVVKLNIATASHATHELSFRPVAYDASNGTLTAMGCSLVQARSEEDGHSRRLFETDVVFRGGETTVLGATGADPTFVVVEVSPVR